MNKSRRAFLGFLAAAPVAAPAIAAAAMAPRTVPPFAKNLGPALWSTGGVVGPIVPKGEVVFTKRMAASLPGIKMVAARGDEPDGAIIVELKADGSTRLYAKGGRNL